MDKRMLPKKKDFDGKASSSSSSASAAAAKGTTAKAKSTSKRTGKRKSSSTNSVDLSSLLPFISRSNLERVISSSVQNNAPANVQDLIAALPEAEKWRFRSDGRVKKSKPVKSGPERVNTGSFNNLDNSIMRNILFFLTPKDRHTVVARTCKGWLDLKTSMPGMFVDLSDSSFDISVPSAHGNWSSTKIMTASQVAGLLDWVPNVSEVTGLRLSTQEKCNPNTVKSTIKKFQAAKKKAKNGQPLSKLILYGPKIYGSLMSEMVRSEVGSGLTSITFSSVNLTQKTKLQGSTAEFFRTCSQLEEVKIPQVLATADGSLRASLISPLSAARSNSTTLLRVLDLTSGGYGAERQLTLREISQLGTFAPELEVLRIETVSGCPTGAPSDIFLGPFLPSPLTPLPRLKDFSLGRIVTSFAYRNAPTYASTDNVNRLLTWLLNGMPIIETFSFAHGTTSMTSKDMRTFTIPPLPGIGEIVWPTTLKHLQLRSLSLESSAFDNADFPSLESVVLKNCGSNVRDIFDGFGRTHPHVKTSDK